MKNAALVIGFFLLLSPSVAWAASPSCSAKGYTVVFVNGVFDTKLQAQANSNALWFQLGRQFNSEPVTVQLGYNPTHLAGAGDLAETASQLFNGSISDFDLDTILMQVYPEVTTRKLMLVGHSQGSFYTNDMYNYLLSHGEPDDSVAVYNVATPAAYTAGHGKYINSSGDTLLTALRAFNFDVLPNNVDLVPTGKDGDYSGHSFASDYLAGAAPQITADIDSELSSLQPTDASNNGDCFTPPNATLGYKTQAVAFAVADPTAVVLKVGGLTVAHASEVALAAATKVAVGALQLFADTITVTTMPPTPAQADTKTLQITNKLYGSSLDNLSPQDRKELLGSSQGAAVALATAPKKVPPPPGIVLGTSTVADDAVTVSSSTPLVPKNIFPQSSNGPVWGGGGPAIATQVVEDAAVPTPAPAEPVDEPATTTVPDQASSTPEEASTTPPVVGPRVLFSDSFDSYDGTGWSTNPINPNGTYTLFAFDDGSTGNCRSGGCLSASNTGAGGLIGGGRFDWMLKNIGGGSSGAFDVWAKKTNGSGHAQGILELCTDISSDCEGSDSALQFGDVVIPDGAWHQYFIAWRQGTVDAQYCYQVDTTNFDTCTWGDTNFPAGTTFNTIIIGGFQSGANPLDGVWFDNLEAFSTPQ